MSTDPTTDIQVLTDSQYLELLIQKASVPSEAAEAAKSQINALSLIPVMKLPKDGFEWVLTKGGEQIPDYRGKRFIDVVVINMRGARALFDSGDGDRKMPRCSTGLQKLQDLQAEATHGEWDDGERTISQPCKGCMYNEWGSAAAWDPKKAGSKAKACGQRDIMFVLPLKRGPQIQTRNPNEEVYLYSESELTKSYQDPTVNPDGMVVFGFSRGSNAKLIGDMGLQATNDGLPFSAIVWRLEIENKSKGSMNWTAVIHRRVGLIDQHLFRKLPKLEAWVQEYIEKYGRAVAMTDDEESVDKSDREVREVKYDSEGNEIHF